jgi:hypothetical protein
VINQAHVKLKHEYRAKGLVALHDFIESDLSGLYKALVTVKHTQDEMLKDNYTRGQIERTNKTLDLIKALLNDDPDK